MSAPAVPAPRRRGLVAALVVAALLFMVTCGLALYAFMLHVDLDEMKRRLSKEVELRLQSERYLGETRNQLVARQREVEQLRLQLTQKESDYQTAVSSRPALPVAVHFRESMLGRGLVAVMRNTSDRYLTVVLSVRNPTLASARRFKIELEPQSSTDFGHLEGWRFSSGDEFDLFNDEFSALRITVP